jgi:serine/threonine-protein kinase
MSPEQIQGLPIDSRSDLYSLGVTAFHMLAGRPPFEGETALALAVQHLQNPPPNLAELRPDVPMELIAIVNQLLEKSPDQRISSAASLIRALREIVDAMHLNWRADHPLPLSNLVVDNQADVTAKTMRLQAVTLEKNREAIKARRLQAVVIAASVLIFGCTFAFTAFYGRKPLIPDQISATPDVSRKSTVEQQYFHALLSDTIANWRAVEEYFPPDASPSSLSYNVKAWLRLSRVCVRQKEFAAAREALLKIIRLEGEADKAMRVLALIEAAGIESSNGNTPMMEMMQKQARMEYASLPPERKEFVDRAIPKEYEVIWNMDTSVASSDTTKAS